MMLGGFDVFSDFSIRSGKAAIAVAGAGLFLSGVISFSGMATAASNQVPAAKTQKTQMKGPKTQKKDPIHINSDRMEAYNQKNLIVFIGNVVAVQGAMEIQSDRLEVYVKKKEKKAQEVTQKMPAVKTGGPSAANSSDASREGSVERLIAIGNVLVNQGKQKYASSDRLDYTESTGIAVLTGKPRAWENNNQVIGTKIELFLREGRSVVYGSRKRRVSVTLFPNSQPGRPSQATKGGVGGK